MAINKMIHKFRFLLLIQVVTFGTLSGCGSSSSEPNSDPDPVIEQEEEQTEEQNHAPELASVIPDQNATVGESFEFDASQDNQTFTDADGDTLSYTLTINQSGSGLDINGAVVSGTPSNSGSYTVSVTASDGELSASTSFTIVIVAQDIEPTPQSKNILLIIADDYGQDASAQYDLADDLPNTPTLNQLANEGLVFENLWVNPSCSPTRSSIISGKYGVRTDVLSPGDELALTEITLQEQLKADAQTSDYATALVGKWHLGNGVSGISDSGIDYFAGVLNGGLADYYDWSLTTFAGEEEITTYSTTEFTNRAIDWIDAQQSPWFLWLAYNAAHTPFHLPPSDLHDRELSGDSADIEANERDYYLAAVESMDTEIGRLLASMDETTRANTVIFFIGDNGTPGRAKDRTAILREAKGSIYEGGVRVPVIVQGAGVERAGQREDALINGTDFYATILSLAGQTTETVHDSHNFESLLSDANAESARDYIYTESIDGYTIRSERYKLIVNSDDSLELYDLVSDPSEASNLVNSGFDDELSELQAAVNAIRGEQTDSENDIESTWIVNTTGERSAYLMDDGEFVEVNVLSVVEQDELFTVTTNAIPNYQVTVTEEALQVYQSRPNRAFSDGQILALGDEVEWGEDVGMSSNCEDTGTNGWTPGGGGACSVSQQEMSLSFPTEPVPASVECETGLGPVGLWVNGVPIYNWSDATTYNDEGVWANFALPFRAAGMDMCNGHSGNGMYHHHSYNVCLRQTVGDEGKGHSPIYGYAGDGYPIHGPYHSDGVLTQSCWIKRDYSANSETGCGVEGERSCVFVDEENIDLGVNSVTLGPSTSDTISFAQAGDGLAVSGIYYQDYYYDAACSAQGDEYLDEHNGHDHDGLGYHYHTSVDDDLQPVFPMVHGPDYYGDLGQGSFSCYRNNF